MQENNGKTRNIVDMITGEYTYNKIWNDKYRVRLRNYYRNPIDMGFEVDMDKATRLDKYYNFEL